MSEIATLSTSSFALATAVRPAFLAGLVIWITLMGYEIAFGKTQDSVAYILTKLGKLVLIGTLALYAWPSISELLSGLKDAALSGGGGAGAAAQIENSVINPMVALWTRMDTWVQKAQVGLGLTDIVQFLGIVIASLVMFIAFLVLMVAAGAMAIVSFAMFMIAQVIFALHLVVGPFFLLCLIFPFTQRFFETYIGSAMTSIFALALTSIVLSIGGNVLSLNTSLSLMTGPAADTPEGFGLFVRSIAVTLCAKAAAAALLIYLFFKIFDLAAALGGGINMGNNLIGGVRSIIADAKGGKQGGGGGAPSSNQISQGGGGGASGGASVGASSKAQAANGGFTFSGAAGRAMGSAAGGAATLAGKGARAVGYAAGRATSFAYNRSSGRKNQISES